MSVSAAFPAAAAGSALNRSSVSALASVDDALAAASADEWSDVSAAMQLLRSECPSDPLHPLLPPVVLVNQLYALLHDRTDVDSQLAAMQRQGQVRLFQLTADRAQRPGCGHTGGLPCSNREHQFSCSRRMRSLMSVNKTMKVFSPPGVANTSNIRPMTSEPRWKCSDFPVCMTCA